MIQSIRSCIGRTINIAHYTVHIYSYKARCINRTHKSNVTDNAYIYVCAIVATDQLRYFIMASENTKS